MSRHRIAELEGWRLSMAVAICDGWTRSGEDESAWYPPSGAVPTSISARGHEQGYGFRPAVLAADAWPIIERKRIGLSPLFDGWGATVGDPVAHDGPTVDAGGFGPTSLVAAMRAFVASKIDGEEIVL